MNRRYPLPRLFWLTLPYAGLVAISGGHQAFGTLMANDTIGLKYLIAPVIFVLYALPGILLALYLYQGSRTSIIVGMLAAPIGGVALFTTLNQLINPSVNQVGLTSVLITAGLVFIVIAELVGRRDLRRVPGL